MKSLREYYNEIKLDTTVNIISENAEKRKAIYRVKRELEKQGVLKEFDYTAKQKDKPATALFIVEDEEVLNVLLNKENLK
jgi:hypothetical protein